MKIHKSKFKIRDSECDSRFQMRLAPLWDLMQTVADEHATILGFDHKKMVESGHFFALMRMNAEVARYPHCGEEIEISTYPAGVQKFFCVRNYEVFGSDGEKITSSSSLWIIVDMAKNRPLRPHLAYPDDEVFKIQYENEGTPGKIEIAENAEYIRDFRAEFSDIDTNNHVNNSRYIKYLEDAIMPLERKIARINTNFIKETKLGEGLEAHMSGNQFQIRDADGSPRFIAEFSDESAS